MAARLRRKIGLTAAVSRITDPRSPSREHAPGHVSRIRVVAPVAAVIALGAVLLAEIVYLAGHTWATGAPTGKGVPIEAGDFGNNIERVANLFLVKSTYSMLLALAVGVVHVPFPFLPRHLTLVGSLTIGIPAFFLALAPNDRLAVPGFVSRVLAFAVPAGALAAVVTFTGYALPLDPKRSPTPRRFVGATATAATRSLSSRRSAARQWARPCFAASPTPSLA